jgi:nitrite reductase/ring-hydroxylating ferredoxin subunit
MEFVKVAATSDVAPGRMIPVAAGGRKLLLANVEGAYFAAARKCPHLGFNLCRGSLEGRAVVCPLHKARFDLATGAIERDPKLLFLQMKSKTDLAVYPVRIEGEDVLVGV